MKASKFTDAQKAFIIKLGEGVPSDRLSQSDRSRIHIARYGSLGLSKDRRCGRLATRQTEDNAYFEALNERFRADCLNAHRFMGPEDTAEKPKPRRRDDNEERPHSAIGNKVPAAPMKLPHASSPSV